MKGVKYFFQFTPVSLGLWDIRYAALQRDRAIIIISYYTDGAQCDVVSLDALVTVPNVEFTLSWH